MAELTITTETGRRENLIIGAMLYRIKVAKRAYMFYGLPDVLSVLQQAFGLYQFFGIYIMTLGVVNELRGLGIAQRMIQYLKGKNSYHI